MILSCEQYCQWCRHAIPKRWEAAGNLRKHAKCHLEKDSPFTIQDAGKGGRAHLSTQNSLIDQQVAFQIPNYGAMRPSSTEPIASEASTSQATQTTLPPQESVGKQIKTEQSSAATPIRLSPPSPEPPKPVICPLILPKKRQQKFPPTTPRRPKKTK
ncbi:hypothetical protein V501_05518 [Pseudogymnoascus sp. VKM F-4519 (FW-2642)]|nr:hypothetical protein V501_05518 [Pseudogymnoascus sp. VKM F-4519 (FW-2642)]